MKFDWDSAKNEFLKTERGISFEEIALFLGSGILWKVTKHWKEEKFPNQLVFLIPIDGYITAVPFVKEGDTYFLKTAFRSRKLTKLYKQELKKEDED